MGPIQHKSKNANQDLRQNTEYRKVTVWWHTIKQFVSSQFHYSGW